MWQRAGSCDHLTNHRNNTVLAFAMVPRVNGSQQLLDSLKSSDTSTRFRAVRQLKNTVIGDKFQKQLYCHLNCIPALLELASSSSDPDLTVQAIAAIGSLAYGVEDGVKAIVSCSGIPQLITALCSNEQGVVVAAARALKLVYKSPLAPPEALLQETALQRLVSLLQQPLHATVTEAAASMLGHCCTDAAKASSIVAAGVVPALAQLLSSQRRSDQEAAVECLESITQHSHEACQQLLQLGTINCGSVAPEQQQAASVTAQCTVQQQKHGAGSSYNAAAGQQPSHAGQAMGLAAGAPAGQLPALQQQQQQLPAVVLQLLQLLRQHDSRLRLLCAACIANLSRGADNDLSSKLMPACESVLCHLVRLLAATDAAAAAAGEVHLGANAAGGPAFRALLGLSGETDRRFLLKVPLVLASLVADRPELLKLAFNLDAVNVLLKLVTSKAAAEPADVASSSSADAALAACQPTSSSNSNKHVTTTKARAKAAAEAAAAKAAVELRIGCFTALGVFAGLGDAARQQMVTEQSGKLVQLVVAALSDSNAQVQGAAAMCLKGLSRSVALLRSGSIPGAAAGPLVALLQDSSVTQVQVAAAGAVCNLLLDFSTVRKALLKAGAVQALVPLTCSMMPELRQYACWALKNMANDCDATEQAALLGQLSYLRFRGLLVADDDARVQGQAVGLLQNLCKGLESIEQLMAWSEGDLLSLLEEQLHPKNYTRLMEAKNSSSSEACADEQQLLQLRLVGLLYATANVCSGYDAHQAAVMNSSIPALLLQHLQGGGGSTAVSSSSSSKWLHEVRLAAVWCVINLLWTDAAAAPAAAASSAETVAARVEALNKLGFVDALKGLLAQCTGATAASGAAAGATETAAAAAAGAGSSGAGVPFPLPPPLPGADAHMHCQDLAERVQTALEQLGSR